ncbi:MAG: winged helix-turn-helix domain-containing protein [Candidatus Woesearchaeota archaeon]|nr:winged helix-turn-helix domain-containing protein [Candidatus Woesearchaeota archaeon]MDP7199271.1 winged helix-turn-helix domain-containing protein [Candidatus Woesearchaeota archaeon]MDP7467922.1 winged helix-turn-helix domain-containing protein [Candidatus Woesearchaeota archaeon]MDP7647874.1 winged helix-turn-helix domain-containing protein [Candidatus Woesearchaeota archaeon]
MKRERMDIIFDILGIIAEREKIIPTHLLYKSNLSYKRLQSYVKELQEKGLMEESTNEKDGKKQFHLSDKGYQFLQRYKELKDLTVAFGI